MYRRILARKNYNASPFNYMSTSSLDAVSASKQGTSVGFFYNNLLYKGRQVITLYVIVNYLLEKQTSFRGFEKIT